MGAYAHSWSGLARWSLVKALLLLAVRPASWTTATGAASWTATTGSRMPTLATVVTTHVRIGSALSVARGKDDLKFNDFVPLGVRALLFGNREQRLQALTWGYWL